MRDQDKKCVKAWAFNDKNFAAWYGVKRKSGRYPFGSGEDPYQHEAWYVGKDLKALNGIQSGSLPKGYDYKRFQEEYRADKLRIKNGELKEIDIAKKYGFETTSKLREAVSNADIERVRMITEAVERSKSENGGKARYAQLERELGISASTIRGVANNMTKGKLTKSKRSLVVKDALKKLTDEKGIIDISDGADKALGVSYTDFKNSIIALELDGYHKWTRKVQQATNPGKFTTITVLAKPDTDYAEFHEPGKIQSVVDYTIRENPDGHVSLSKKFEYPASLDPSRLHVRTADELMPDGHPAVDKDGTIEIRRGCKDLDLGGSNYAQVRILVGKDKYLKGIAYYSDNMPDGVDVVFNSNKSSPEKALKAIKTEDPMNPFGTSIKENGGQYHYKDPITGEEKLGLINKKSDEGDWGEWAKTLPAQFLAKQNQKLIDTQLKESVDRKRTEFAEIMAIENATVKRKMLADFAQECDSTAVNLEAASLPRQRYQVLLPAPTLGDNEVYAPGYKNGEHVALVRFPHAGTYEIVYAKVNNNNAEAIADYGKGTLDAVAVNHANAMKLSGADHDGDTVLVIPTDNLYNGLKVNYRDSLPGLKGFDPSDSYPGYEGMKVLSKEDTQRKMGEVSNLIMDMTLRGASDDEMTRAVKHSMVIIDANKHELDWTRSEKENHIRELIERYQYKIDPKTGEIKYGGASTVITRAKSPEIIPERDYKTDIDPETGKVSYRSTGRTYIDKKTGKIVEATEKHKKMELVDDAWDLATVGKSMVTPQERAYIQYANAMKTMANEARKEWIVTERPKRDTQAAHQYKDIVAKLTAQLDIAESNAPRERMAQLYADARRREAFGAAADDGIDTDNKDFKKAMSKLAARALAEGRIIYGAKRHKIDITESDWEAIQARAIGDSKLEKILKYADPDKVRQYATPKEYRYSISPARESQIRARIKSGSWTLEQIADAFGVSVSAVGDIAKDIRKKGNEGD